MPDGVDLVCRGVTKSYATSDGAVDALHDVDAAFVAGGVNALIGPSGCGKSTLLRLVAGLDTADAGSIRAGTHELESAGPRELRDYRSSVVTYVTQRASANLVDHLRLRDHFEGSPSQELLDAVGLADRLGARPTELSGGEQARAALAVAIARATPVILLDEPTAELDRATADHVRELLAHAAAGGTTVVVATHDPDLTSAADTVVDLGAGLVVNELRPHEAPPRVAGAGLRVEGITKRYGDAIAVDDASFELGAGEFGVILGRSGSGKSTLLMILGGWLAADAGSSSVTSTGWADVGYLPQRFGLLPELTVAENIGLPARVGGRWNDARVNALLDELDLGGLGGRLPSETSIGQQQRAALARALVLRPRLLLADEPTSHQDARSAERTRSALADARDAGTACLIATHDESAVARADRVWEIVDGRLTPR